LARVKIFLVFRLRVRIFLIFGIMFLKLALRFKDEFLKIFWLKV